MLRLSRLKQASHAVTVAGGVALVVGLSGCNDPDAVRLVAGRADTVVVHTRESAPPVLHLVDSAGERHRARRVRFQLVSGSGVGLEDDGSIGCGDAPADAQVRATSGRLTTMVTVLCRPLRGFNATRVRRLVLGGSPVPLGVSATGFDGQDVDPIAATITVQDSQVVVFRGGDLHARALGATTIDVEAAGCILSVPVEVIGPATMPDEMRQHEQYTEALTLSPGELRSWRLPLGRFQVFLLGDNAARDGLALATHQMNCAKWPRSEEVHYMCIAKAGAAVIVRHEEPAGRGRVSSGTLVVERMADTDAWSQRSARATANDCPHFFGSQRVVSR